MRIIAVEDEQNALSELENAINEAVPACELNLFLLAQEALDFAEKNLIDVAFLDIEMPGISGLELAKRLKDINSQTNIIFVTGYSEYAFDALSMHASGYVLKPMTASDISREIDALRFPVKREQDKLLQAHTFGNFDVLVNGKPLYFPRSKSKELLAYLIHKKGTSCSVRELAAVIFEDKENGAKQIQTYINTMMKVLDDAGVKDAVVKKYNSLAVDVDKIDCDFYRFLEGDTEAVNAYAGEYMANYSWAEFTIGYLDQKVIL